MSALVDWFWRLLRQLDALLAALLSDPVDLDERGSFDLDGFYPDGFCE